MSGRARVRARGITTGQSAREVGQAAGDVVVSTSVCPVAILGSIFLFVHLLIL